MSTKHFFLITAFALTLCACDDKAPSGDAASSAATADKKVAGDKPADKPADKTAVPSCDKVVDNIASFNEGSGDAERKLWGKMCADMSDDEKGCVAKAKDMDGMKACIKKDKKLK